MILSLALGFVVLIVAAWVGYTVWDDARRIREAELRMKESRVGSTVRNRCIPADAGAKGGR